MSTSESFANYLHLNQTMHNAIYRGFECSCTASHLAVVMDNLRQKYKTPGPDSFNQEDWELLELGLDRIKQRYLSCHNFGELVDALERTYNVPSSHSGIQIRLMSVKESEIAFIAPYFQHVEIQPRQDIHAPLIDFIDDCFGGSETCPGINLGQYAFQPEAYIKPLFDYAAGETYGNFGKMVHESLSNENFGDPNDYYSISFGQFANQLETSLKALLNTDLATRIGFLLPQDRSQTWQPSEDLPHYSYRYMNVFKFDPKSCLKGDERTLVMKIGIWVASRYGYCDTKLMCSQLMKTFCDFLAPLPYLFFATGGIHEGDEYTNDDYI